MPWHTQTQPMGGVMQGVMWGVMQGVVEAPGRGSRSGQGQVWGGGCAGEVAGDMGVCPNAVTCATPQDVPWPLPCHAHGG